VTAKALLRKSVRSRLVPILFGDEGDRARFDPRFEFRVVSRLKAEHRRPGIPSKAGGAAQYQAIERLIEAAQTGELDAMCTAPVSKEHISKAGISFMGHTEVLASAFGVKVVMLMKGPRLSVALATNHLPLAQVPAALTREGLLAVLCCVDSGLGKVLARRPAIAVCGLNPHAGEGGLLGREEAEIIVPAMRAARRKGLVLTGPHGADGLFAHRKGFDVAVAMFHDQGLVATKTLDFERTVNVTLGLPVPRTSPDHGTAYGLVRGAPSEVPMVSALCEAASFAGAR
jgi:4-hydroxythreonine-4-phosphate dehydrogenase